MASAPAWPAWGPRIMESDVDYDIADFIDDECGFKLFHHWVIDEGGLGLEGSRAMLNGGLFNRLFDKYKAYGPYYKKYGGKYFSVVLIHLAMEVGATITEEQLAYAKTVYKSASLFTEGIHQFETALSKYKNGTPYNFGSKGLHESLASKPQNSAPFSGNHHGARFFEDGVPTSELARTIMDRRAPLSCDYCGQEELVGDTKRLLRCGRCKREQYCNKECQKSDWKIHKKHCYTQAQQEARMKSGNGPATYFTSFDACGTKFTAHMASPETFQSRRF